MRLDLTFLCTGVLGLLASAAPIGLHAVTIAACAAILLFGLPHGAYDAAILQSRWQGHARWFAVGGYLCLAGATAAAWWTSPSVFLAVFLALSAVHFGTSDWPEENWVVACAWGVSVISLPALFHPATTEALLSALAPNAALLTEALPYACGPAVAVALLGARLNTALRLELLALVALFWLCSPLIAFSVYFCAVHSRRHLHTWRARLGHGPRRNVWAISLMAICAFAVAYLWVGQPGTLSSDAIRVTFVGLAALTVPHMLLTWFVSRSRRPMESGSPVMTAPARSIP